MSARVPAPEAARRGSGCVRCRELEKENARLTRENETLKARIERLHGRVDAAERAGKRQALVDSPEAEFVIRSGPARVILMGEVARWGADLLVVGSHGWGWSDRALVGGVSEGLLNHLPTSLVVVPILAAGPPSGSERAGAAVEASTAPAA